MQRSIVKIVTFGALGALCLFLGGVAVAPWTADPLVNLGRQPPAPAPGDDSQPGYVLAFEAPAPEALAVIVERPIFTASRRPPPAVLPAPAAPAAETLDKSLILGRYKLTGVVVTPTLRLVFVTRPGSRKTIAVARGKKLDGWVISEVEQHLIVLESDQGRIRIKIEDDAGIEIISE